jgi:hypothetical protein
VISDKELGELFELGRELTEQHLAFDNSGVPPAQQRHSLVMDFEFRRVSAGWPALKQGTSPARFVVKQMRPLEPSPRVNAALRAAPIPHDVLARARRIENRHCRGAGIELDVLSVLTDPNALPDVGFAKTPLLAGLGVTVSGAAPRVYTHLELRSVQQSASGLVVELAPGLPLTRVELSGASASVLFKDGRRATAPVQCENRLDYAEPRELLRSFLE